MAVMKRPSSSPIKEVIEEEASMREGILTVLRGESPSAAKSSPSIRRTLSADMSSKKWLAQNGFSLTPPPTLTTKVNNISNIHKGEEELNHPSQDDVWRSIQSRKDNKIAKESEPIWDSILTDNRQATNKENKLLQPRKRSLSEKSLEICTESLGSETGSDSYGSPSEFSYAADHDDDHEELEKTVNNIQDPDFSENPEFVPVKYKNAPAQPFPPPIRSISSVDSSLQMRSRRENGRLVLDAVSTPPRNRFVARRGNGRLVLTVIDHRKPGNNEITEEIARSNPVMKKRNKKNTRWNDKAVEESEEEEITAQSSSLPPLPRVPRMIPKPPQAASNSVSSYDYECFWRNKAASKGTVSGKEGFVSPRVIVNKYANPMLLSRNQDYYNDGSEDKVVLRGSGGKVESFAAYLKGCKDAKRSLLIWEPYCIATS